MDNEASNDSIEALCKKIACCFGKSIGSIKDWIINISLSLAQDVNEEALNELFPQVYTDFQSKKNNACDAFDEILANFESNLLFEKDPKGKGLLVPDFINKPLLKDDICDIDCDWGPEYYITHFPFLDRTMNDNNCTISRNFIRSTLKKREVYVCSHIASICFCAYVYMFPHF